MPPFIRYTKPTPANACLVNAAFVAHAEFDAKSSTLTLVLACGDRESRVVKLSGNEATEALKVLESLT